MSAGPTIHDRAVIISTGDEITVGQLLDTNSKYIAERLMDIGILPIEHMTVPDNLDVLVDAIGRAAAKAPLVIMSGGLGPTDGDLTRQALARFLNDELVLDAEAEAAIVVLLARRGRAMTDRQKRQAFRPSRAKCIANAFGTAPGLHAVDLRGKAEMFFLPGPPGELKPMFQQSVLPALKTDPKRCIATKVAHIVGVPEADCVTRLGDLTKRDRNPLVGITASGGILTLRVRFEGACAMPEAQAQIESTLNEAKSLLGDHLFATGQATDGVGWEMLVKTVLKLLGEKHATLATVESCTGGMLGEMITTIPGSSSQYAGGFVTYANSMKERLGVHATSLAEHGAVSSQVACELASSGLAQSGAAYAVSITGIAGPGGATAHKPVGTVHIGLARREGGENHVVSRQFLFTGDREDVRRRACVSALTMLYFDLLGKDAPKLLWQV